MLKNRKILFLAAGSLLSALAVTSSASAGEQAKTNLGPVGPHKPILITVGKSRLVAYYQPDDGKCAVNAVIFATSPRGGGYASTRVRVALHPGELFHLDSANGDRAVLTCGPNAKGLTVLNRGEIRARSASRILY